MSQSMNKPYPGEAATAQQLLGLASAYQAAATVLREQGCSKHTIASAPLHLTAIHAIELYLNAFLLHTGVSPAEVRGLKHCLVDRRKLAQEAGMVLRVKTSKHLDRMSSDREYLVARYEPELREAMSHINRLMATLDEVSKKVKIMVSDEKTPP